MKWYLHYIMATTLQEHLICWIHKALAEKALKIRSTCDTVRNEVMSLKRVISL